MGLWRVAKEGDIQDGGRVCLELEGALFSILFYLIIFTLILQCPDKLLNCIRFSFVQMTV